MNIHFNPDKIDRIQWKQFVDKHPLGTIFHTPEMYDVYLATKNYKPLFICVTNDKNEIKALLLAVIQSEGSGIKKLLTSRSIIFGGPLYIDDKLNCLEVCLSEYCKIVRSQAIYTQIRNFITQPPELQELYKKIGFQYEAHLNILVPILPDEQSMWKGVKRNRKDGINKARKAGFVFNTETQSIPTGTFYELVKELFHKIKLPFPHISFFENLKQIMPENVIFFTLKYNDLPIVSLCALSYKQTLYAFYIGIRQDKEIERMRPVDLFYWEVLRWCVANNIHTYDWLGAGKPNEEYGVRDFKLQYGGYVFEPGRYVRIHKPLLMKIGKLGLFLWKKLKK